MGAVGRLGLAVVGYAFGGPLGFAIGAVAGSFLFPQKFPDIEQQGPRMDDVGVTSSAYGQGIPRVWGTHIVSGNVIWMGRIHEHSKTTEDTVGGKGGGGGQTTRYTEYSYTASMAVLLSEGPMKQIVKITADGQTVYDATGTAVQMQVPGLHFRFYAGTETQLPDSIIVAKEGYDNTSAYRGSCYIVFDELPLTPFGNRIPTFQFVIQDSGESIIATLPLDETYSRFYYGVDYQYGRKYQLTGGFTPKIESTSLFTRKSVLAVDAPSGYNGRGYENILCIAPGGDFIATTSGATTNALFIKPNDSIALIDGGTLAIKKEALPLNFQFSAANSGACARYSGIDGTERIILIFGANWVSTVRYSMGGYDLAAEGPPENMQMELDGLPDEDGQFYYFTNGAEIPAGLEFWGVWGKSADEFVFFQVEVKDKIEAGLFGDPTFEAAAQFDIVKTFNRSDIDARITSLFDPNMFGLNTSQNNFGLDGMMYDASDDTVIMSFMRSAFIIKVDTGGEIIWRFEGRPNYTPLPSDYSFTLQPGNRIDGGTYAFHGENAAGVPGWHVIDTRSGMAVDFAPSVGPSAYQSPYDSYNRMAVTADSILYFGRAPEGRASIATIVDEVSAECGQTFNDFAGISDLTVAGYLRAKPMTGRATISPLASFYNFDAIDAGGYLRWIQRGQPAVASYKPEDMVVVDEDTGSVVSNVRQQEPELPQAVAITYFDPARNYESSTYSRQRYTGNEGYQTMRSRNQVSLTVPVATDPATVKRQADVFLMGAWNGRDGQTLRLPRPAMLLDPGDVITIEIPDVFPQDVRIDSHSVGADMAIEVKSTSQDSSQYVSVVEAEEGSGFPDMFIPVEMLTRLYLLPVPYLQDANDRLRQSLVQFFAMGAYSPGWRDGLLERLSGAGTWQAVGSTQHDAAHGAILDVWPAANPDTIFCTIEDLTLRVRLIQGDLQPVTQDQLYDGANAAAIIRSGTAAEVIQFRDATLEDDGTYTLSGFLRGRRGTDSWALEADTQTGAAFVLLAQGVVGAVPVILADHGITQAYRASGGNQDPDDGDVRSARVGGYGLMPYAPVHIELTESGSDLVVDWERRTRLRGEIRGGTGEVPLEEDNERYEVDISVNDVVVRMIPATTPSATYTNAMQIEDGVGPHVQVSIVIYQMSAQVGRGFPSYPVSFGQTLEVAQESVFALTTIGQPQIEIAQDSVFKISLTNPSIHVAQDSVFAITDAPLIKEGDGEIAQHAEFTFTTLGKPPLYHHAQHSIFIIQEDEL